MIINDHKKAMICGDQTSCAVCGKAWDTNDYDPPACDTNGGSDEADDQKEV